MTSQLFRGSKHALLYSKFRPSPPPEFINLVIEYVKNKVDNTLKQAIDVGCGSGQSTIVLAPYFEKVFGYDISESQIDCAKSERSAHNIEYRVSNCEKLPFPDSSFQLVTSSQAVHWFDTSKLFNQVQRILVPKGCVAVYGYWIPFPKTTNEEINKKIEYLIEEELHEKQLGNYWNNERYIVKNHYRDLLFPFKDVQRLDLIKKSECSLADYVGYLSSWSAYQKLCNEDNEKGEKLLKDFKNQFLDILGQKKALEEIKFSLHTDFFMLMGHN